MTVLYLDVSHHDWNRRGGQLDWEKIRAATSPVMIARATYGDPSGWNRPSYHHADLHRGAKAAGFTLRGSYANFIRGDAASIARQVDWLRREMDHVGAVWAMADIERYPEMMSAGVFPRWSDVQRLNDRWQAVEDRVMAWYLPEWVWERGDMGRPDLRELNGPLVSSRYPLSYTQDTAGDLYARCGGGTGKGWQVYEYNGTSGKVLPRLWQFTSSALVPGTKGGADCNAFQGSLAQLTQLLHPTAHTAPEEEDDMQLTDPVSLVSKSDVQYSSPTTTVGGVLASTNYYVLQTRNKVLAELADAKLRDEAILRAVTGADHDQVLSAIQAQGDQIRAELAARAAEDERRDAEMAGLLAKATSGELTAEQVLVKLRDLLPAGGTAAAS